MQKLTLNLVLALMLVACTEDMSDLEQYVADVKRNAKIRVEPIPAVNEFVHVEYNMVSPRSPFELPSPEVVEDNYIAVQNCLAPDPRRRKQPLEKFPLDNLSMRGTLGSGKEIWALIQASDGSLHRVTVDNYVGLFHGRITSVSDENVQLIELIPDGAGCWKERVAIVSMIDDAADD